MKKMFAKITAGIVSVAMLCGIGFVSTKLARDNAEQVNAAYSSASPWSYTFAANDITTADSTKTLNNVTWSIAGAAYVGWDNTKGIQLGSGNNPQKSDWTMSAPISQFGTNVSITKISMNLSTASQGGIAWTFAAGSSSNGGTAAATTSVTEKSVSFSPAVSSGDVVITLNSNNKAKAIYVKSISIEFTSGSATPAKTISIDQGDTATCEVDSIIDLSATLGNCADDEIINWEVTSSNAEHADVDSESFSGGTVNFTADAAGIYTVTATIDETNISDSIDITVTEPVDPSLVTYTFDLFTDTTTTATTEKMSWVAENVKLTAYKAESTTNANNYYPGVNNYKSTRFYKDSEIRFDALNGNIIKRIEFVATTEGYATACASNNWSYSSANVDSTDTTKTVVVSSVDTNVIKAAVGATQGFTAITVFYKAGSSAVNDPEPTEPDTPTLNYGTLSNPLTVEEARTLIDSDTKPTTETMYVTGIVEQSTYYASSKTYTVWLQNSDGTVGKYFELYKISLSNSVVGDFSQDNSLRGKTVVASGYGTLYNTTYEITPKDDSDTSCLIISVTDSPSVSPTTVFLSELSKELSVGDTFTLTAKLYPANATGTIVWSSSNASVASVDNGVVTANAAGTADITATCGSISKTCNVTVTSSTVDPDTPSQYKYVRVSSVSDITEGEYAIVGTKPDKTNWYYLPSTALTSAKVVPGTELNVAKTVNSFVCDSEDAFYTLSIDTSTSSDTSKTISFKNSTKYLNGGQSDTKLSHNTIYKWTLTEGLSSGTFRCTSETATRALAISENTSTHVVTFGNYNISSGITNSSPTAYDIALFKRVSNEEYSLSSFVSDFNALVASKCDPNGVTSTITTSDWDNLATSWAKITDSKTPFVSGTLSDEASVHAINTYDYIVLRYGWTDFAGRNPASGSPAIKSLIDDASGVTTIVTVTAIASITLVGGFTLTRKRKHF